MLDANNFIKNFSPKISKNLINFDQKFHKFYYKLTASFCHKVAAWVTDIFASLIQQKNHKIVNNLATTESRENISTNFGQFHKTQCL